MTISAEEFEREWDKTWPDTDSADLAVRMAGLAARRQAEATLHIPWDTSDLGRG